MATDSPVVLDEHAWMVMDGGRPARVAARGSAAPGVAAIRRLAAARGWAITLLAFREVSPAVWQAEIATALPARGGRIRS